MTWSGSGSFQTPITVAELRATTLPVTRWGEGYEIEAVNGLLAAIAQALEARERGHAPTMTADQVMNAKFGATKFRRGYVQRPVDDLLDRAAAALR